MPLFASQTDWCLTESPSCHWRCNNRGNQALNIFWSSLKPGCHQQCKRQSITSVIISYMDLTTQMEDPAAQLCPKVATSVVISGSCCRSEKTCPPTTVQSLMPCNQIQHKNPAPCELTFVVVSPQPKHCFSLLSLLSRLSFSLSD